MKLRDSIANATKGTETMDAKMVQFEAQVIIFNAKVETWAESTEARNAMTKLSEDCVKTVVETEFGKVKQDIAEAQSSLSSLRIEHEGFTMNQNATIYDMSAKLHTVEMNAANSIIQVDNNFEGKIKLMTNAMEMRFKTIEARADG